MHFYSILFLLPLIAADAGKFTHKYHAVQCTTPKVRKEWRAMPPSEQSRFIQAVRKLQTATTGVSEYDRFAQSHGDNASLMHGVACFLPWHRIFLYQYEKALQDVDPQVSLPYWGWHLDSQAPEASPIWKSFGGNGVNGCVKDGPFKDYKPAFIEPNSGLPKCLAREFNGASGKSANDRIGAFDNPEGINLIMSASPDFGTFAPTIEGRPHAVVHNNIGGLMQTMYSPSDPVFYLHHANLDKMWADWQTLNPRNLNSYGGFNADGSQATPQDTLPLYPQVRVNQVFDTKKLCYTYETLTNQVARDSTPQLPTPIVPTNRKLEENKEARGTPTPPKPVVAPPPLPKPTGPPPKPIVPPPPPTGPRLVGALPPQSSHNKYPIPLPKPDIKPIDPKVKVEPKPDGSSAVPDDSRSNVGKLAVLAPLPEQWILKNKLNLAKTRQNEIMLNNATYTLNHVAGYTSPASLFRQTGLFAEVVRLAGNQPGKPYFMDIGTQRVIVSSTSPNPLVAVSNMRARLERSVQNPDAFRGLMSNLAPVLASIIGAPAFSTNSAMNPYGGTNPSVDKPYGKENKAELAGKGPKSLTDLTRQIPMQTVQKQTTLAGQRYTTVK